MPVECEEAFYWEHPDKRQCVRFVYKSFSNELIGMNFFGIRMRQEVCQRWIKERRTIEFALENLREANFDPEFFHHYEQDILDDYNLKFGKQIQLKQKEGFLSRIFA